MDFNLYSPTEGCTTRAAPNMHTGNAAHVPQCGRSPNTIEATAVVMSGATKEGTAV